MPVISKNGYEVPDLNGRTAKLMWDLSRCGPTRQCENVKTVCGWRAIRHQYGTRSTNALRVATIAAKQSGGMVYILYADDKVSRVMIDWKNKVCVSSAYPN